MTKQTSSRSKLSAPLAFVSGVLFAVGLALGGMTQPAKVVAFLDVAGAWDPSLAFVMMGAIAVYRAATRFVAKRPAPWTGGSFQLPTRRDIDPRLVLGAGLFGVGWGLGGYCPGPGITAVSSGSMEALTFVAAMAAGMLLYETLQNGRVRRGRPPREPAREPMPAQDAP